MTPRTDGAVYLMDWPGRPGDKYRPAVVWDGTKECWRYPGSGIRAWERNGEPEGATYERLYTQAELDQMIGRYDFNRVMAGEINSREIADGGQFGCWADSDEEEPRTAEPWGGYRS